LLDSLEDDRDQAQAASDLLIQRLDGDWVQRSLHKRQTTQDIELDYYQPGVGRMEANADSLGSGLTIHLMNLDIPPPPFPLIFPTPPASEAGTFDGAGTVDGAENFSSSATTPTATTPTATTPTTSANPQFAGVADLHARFQAAYRVQAELEAEQADLDERVLANDKVLAALQEELDLSHPGL
jgi:hypothetical protein